MRLTLDDFGSLLCLLVFSIADIGRLVPVLMSISFKFRLSSSDLVWIAFASFFLPPLYESGCSLMNHAKRECCPSSFVRESMSLCQSRHACTQGCRARSDIRTQWSWFAWLSLMSRCLRRRWRPSLWSTMSMSWASNRQKSLVAAQLSLFPFITTLFGIGRGYPSSLVFLYVANSVCQESSECPP